MQWCMNLYSPTREIPCIFRICIIEFVLLLKVGEDVFNMSCNLIIIFIKILFYIYHIYQIIHKFIQTLFLNSFIFIFILWNKQSYFSLTISSNSSTHSLVNLFIIESKHTQILTKTNKWIWTLPSNQ